MKETQRRYSKQRELILETVKSSRRHPTAEEVYAEVKQLHPNISLGTVYRNLNLLTEQGDIINLNEGLDADHFDGVCSNHCHLVCTRCKRVYDLDFDIGEVAEGITTAASGAGKPEVHNVRVMAFGLCPDCKAQQTTETQNLTNGKAEQI